MTVTNPTSPAPASPAPPEKADRVHDRQFVIDEVLRQLGTPETLFRVTASNVWANHYRVNVYCTLDRDRAVKPVVMTDSFFVDLTDDGIVTVPPIVRRYGSNPAAAV